MEERVQFDPTLTRALGSQQRAVGVERPGAGSMMTPGRRLTGLRVAGDPGVSVAADLDLRGVTDLTPAVVYHSAPPSVLGAGLSRLPDLQVEILSVGTSLGLRNAGDAVIPTAELTDDDKSDGAHDKENYKRQILIFCV